MSEYKLVPADAIRRAASILGSQGFEAWDQLASELESMIASATAVQREPVAVVDADDDGMWADILPDVTVKVGQTLYAAPQPEEQQPSADDSLTPVPDELFAAEFAAWWEEHGQFCRAGGGAYEQSFAFEAWRHLYPQLMNLQMVAVEQQPAPDVAGLVEALEQIRAIEDELYGGDWDEIEKARNIANEALAAHRKQQEGQP